MVEVLGVLVRVAAFVFGGAELAVGGMAAERVDGARPRLRAISRTPHFLVRSTAISSRSANDR